MTRYLPTLVCVVWVLALAIMAATALGDELAHEIAALPTWGAK